MKTIIILLLAAAGASAQLRAPIQGLIKYEVLGAHTFNVDSVGQIEIYPDSVKAFNMTWQLMGQEKMKTDGARIIRGIYDLQYKDQRAILIVIHKRASFMIPGYQDIDLIQLPW